MKNTKLLLNGIIKLASGIAIIVLLLFLPAGTFNYPNAWLFCALLFIPMLIVGIILYIKDPEMLKKRLNGKEKEKEQKGVIIASALIFVVSFALAGLSFRFGWLRMPKWVIIAASVLLLAAYGMWAEVMRENAYLSRTVEIQENQKVVDTGLYGIVRHPMYAAALLLYIAMPLVLGSVISAAVSLLLIPVLAARINNEEKVLEAGLEGYTEYKKKVKYRLVPFIW